MRGDPRIPGLRRVVRIPGSRIERDVDDEIAFHVESRVRELIAQGHSEDVARQTAEAEFGDLRASRGELVAVDRRRRRREVAAEWLYNGASSFRVAWRTLRRAPAFAITAALTLSIGIGATTAIFTVLDSVVLRPLPYHDPERLAGVLFSLPGMGFDRAPQSLSSYYTFRRLARSFDGLALLDRSSVNLEDVDGGGKPERVRSAAVSATLFTILGTSFERGRGFTDAEDAPRGDPVVVIDDGLWRRRFGADTAIVGKMVKIDGRPQRIVGVTAPDFHFPDAATQLWLPIALDSASPFGGGFIHQGIGRLKPGVSFASAQLELTRLVPRIAELYPDIVPGMPTKPFLDKSRASPLVHPMRDDVVGNFTAVVWIAGAAGTLLLLITLANVASLLVTRAEGRHRELAVRAALGAHRARIAGQFLAESLLLAAVGGVVGLAVAAACVGAFVRLGPPGIPRLTEIHVNQSVLAFVALVTLSTALVCSLVPVLRVDRRRLSERLRDGTRGGTSGRDRQRARQLLVITQVAFATVLAGSSALLLRSFDRLRHVDPGFDAEHTLTLWLSLPSTTYPTQPDVVRFTMQLLDRVRVVPGLRAVGASSKVPLNPVGANYSPVWSDADRESGNTLPPSKEFVAVTGDYFSAMGIPLLAGRTFDRLDRQNAREVIVDRSFAAQYWGDSTGRGAVGHRIRVTQNDWLTVIGVVGAVHDSSLAASPSGLVYVPDVAASDTNQSFVTRTLAVTVRGRGDPRAAIEPVQRAISDIDRSLPTFNVGPMSDIVEESMGRLSFVMMILGVSAAVALLLAAVGLYGVLAHIVSLRSREISVRLAVGAAPAAVARLVGRQGVTLALLGVGAGIAVFVPASRLLRTFITGVGRPDALTVVGFACCLMIVAFAASWIPAFRASRLDPARALTGD